MTDGQGSVQGLGKPNPREGRVTDFTLTTPHLSQLPPAFENRQQGVFLFVKQNETKTTFTPNNTVSNSLTKRGELMVVKR